MPRVAILVLILAFHIYALVEVIGSSRSRVMPRWAWALVTLLVPVIGPVLWFAGGRPQRRMPPPDDDPNFFRGR